MSPDPWPAKLPMRARPSPTRRATRVSWRASSGMSVHDDPDAAPASLRWHAARVEQPADGHARDAELAEPAEVGEHEDAEGPDAVDHP